MGPAGIHAALERLLRDVAKWPPLLRDPFAAALALWSVCLGVLLASVLPFHAEVLLALPGVVLAWLLFGGSSAAFGLLVAALAVTWVAEGRRVSLFAAGAEEALVLFLLACGLGTACLGARLWVRQRERRAALLMDACAEDAVSRISAAEVRLAEAEAGAKAARQRLARAEADLAGALRSAAEAARRDATLDDGFEEARRREGGV
ncbi:hypothetical protein [Falsiroseomonas sp.]|uniref:hypothetical protein n=1 Tax=Falsiroseomonas sp. TaxID=2870721 RepID=UPI00356780F0